MNMLFRGLIHNKQAMCYSSQKKGHEDRKLFFLPKYEKYILPSRTNQLMTSRVPASPRAARSWHLELAQPLPEPLPSSLPEQAGSWDSPGSFLLSTADGEATVELLNSIPGSPTPNSLWLRQLHPQSFPEPIHSFIHFFNSRNVLPSEWEAIAGT